MSVSFDIKADARTYRVDIAPGTAFSFLEQLPRDCIVICDEFFADRCKALPCPVLAIPALETKKTLDAAARLVEAARQAGLSRSGQIVAVGGGIIQDVACFVASIYMRGVAWTYLPTTVLAMVDSCIGGKSSINVGRFKNLAGTMHPPTHILVDTDFAYTLALDHRAGGLCEAAKITFARGAETFERYAALNPGVRMESADLAAVVALSLQAKQWFIEIDEFDKRERLTLNFGHTFGHAIESATGFAINHGAAVGIGMLCAMAFVEADNASSAVPATTVLAGHSRELLRAIPDVAVQFSAMDREAFRQALLSDKKHTPERLTLVLPTSSSTLGLPLDLCRFARGEQVALQIDAAVEHVQKALAA